MNNQRLFENSQVLTKLIKLTSELYHDKTLNNSQRAFLQTLIGAGIWYLPSDKRLLFNGKISQAALDQLKTDPKTKLVEEHFIPRKIAGQALYSNYLEEIKSNDSFLQELYLQKIGKFNYVLKVENSRLAKFQRADKFIDEESAYRNAGIEMVTITLDEVEKLKKRKPNN